MKLNELTKYINRWITKIRIYAKTKITLRSDVCFNMVNSMDTLIDVNVNFQEVKCK